MSLEKLKSASRILLTKKKKKMALDSFRLPFFLKKNRKTTF